MDHSEKINTLWESHNFYLQQINVLEDEFSFLAERARLFFYQPVIEAMRQMESDPAFEATLPTELVNEVQSLLEGYDAEEVPIDRNTLLSQIKRVSKDLEALYLKHLHTIKDIKAFYTEYPYDIPAHHEISDPALIDELGNSTKDLIKSHRRSSRLLYKEVKNYKCP